MNIQMDRRYYYLCLRNLLVFVRKLEDADILFVLSKQNAGIRKLVYTAAKSLRQRVISDTWTPGRLTNWQGVGSRNAISHDSKTAFAHHYGGIPDILIILHPSSSHLAVREGKRLGIPMVYLTDNPMYQSFACVQYGEFVIPINPNSYHEVYDFMQSLCSFAHHIGFGSSDGRAKD